jgi:hypothetical protein
MASSVKVQHDALTESITEALSTPFELREVKWKPQAVKGNSALAVAYVDVRVIQDRLDDVLGVAGWQDEYQLLPDSSVMCRLRLKIGKRWITKMDVGSPSEQPDGGDRLKAAFSDALKRAAVKFGIGRYLYRLPLQWADYDPAKKKFTSQPKLPAFAMPKISKPEPVMTKGMLKEDEPIRVPVKGAKLPLPATGREMHQRLRDKDSELASQGRCMIGALLAHITQAGMKAGLSGDLDTWSGPAIELAVEQTKKFMAQLPSEKAVA